MGLLRGRRGDDGGTKYQMREQMFSIGDDYWIENDGGERVYKVNGKALRIRDTFVLEVARRQGGVHDPGAEAQRPRQRWRSSAAARRWPRCRRRSIAPLRDRCKIDVEDGEDMEAQGNIVDHEYEIERDGDKVAEVSKKWFRVRDTYGIEIEPGQDDALILAITVCIDQMTHDVG